MSAASQQCHVHAALITYKVIYALRVLVLKAHHLQCSDSLCILCVEQLEGL